MSMPSWSCAQEVAFSSGQPKLLVALFQAWHAHHHFPVKHIPLASGRLHRLTPLCVLSGQALSFNSPAILQQLCMQCPQQLRECFSGRALVPVLFQQLCDTSCDRPIQGILSTISSQMLTFGLTCVETSWRPIENLLASSCCVIPPSLRSVG